MRAAIAGVVVGHGVNALMKRTLSLARESKKGDVFLSYP
jgi:hypothetical protein